MLSCNRCDAIGGLLKRAGTMSAPMLAHHLGIIWLSIFEISKGRYVCPPRRGCPRACCGLRAPRLHLWTAPPLSMWNIRRRVGAGRPCSGAACSLVTSVDCVLGSSWTLRPVMAVLLRPGSGAWQSNPGDTCYGRPRAQLNWASAVCGGIAR